jgi:hypothetical protein
MGGFLLRFKGFLIPRIISVPPPCAAGALFLSGFRHFSVCNNPLKMLHIEIVVRFPKKKQKERGTEIMKFLGREKGARRFPAIALAAALLVFAAGSLAFKAQADGEIDDLTLEIGVEGSADFTDVDDIPDNAIDWSVSTPRQRIQIEANFSEVQTEKDRTVTVTVPRGLKILSCSAAQGAPNVSGVQKIAFSDQDEAKVTSSALTLSTAITGYTSYSMDIYDPSEYSYKVYDGTIDYVFNANCDRIDLTVILGFDIGVFPHDQTSVPLEPIAVKLRSGGVEREKQLNVTVTGVVSTDWEANMPGGSSTVPGIVDEFDEDKGTVPMFDTGHLTSAVGGGINQYHFAEKLVYEVVYPLSVTFEGFTDLLFNARNTNRVPLGDFSGGTYVVNSHLTVTHDAAARKVTFTYSNVGIRYRGIARCHWTAEVDNTNIKWNGQIPFDYTLTESSGAYVKGAPQQHAQRRHTFNITVKKANWNITITPRNSLRGDLNAYADGHYPYDYLLGVFNVSNAGPSKTAPLLYSYTFSPNLAVRGVSLPGLVGDNYTSVVFTTNIRKEPFCQRSFSTKVYLFSVHCKKDNISVRNLPPALA